MSHTNSTTNYNLPQFVTTDKPAWLTDINGAFSAIDTAIDAAKDAADAAQTDATQAGTDAGTALTTANAADGKGSGAIASIAEQFSTSSTYAIGDVVIYNNLLYKCGAAVTTPGPWTGSTNWTRVTVNGLIPKTASDLPLTSSPSSMSTKEAIDDINAKLTWNFVGEIIDGGIGVDISAYTDLIVMPIINQSTKYAPYIIWKQSLSTPINIFAFRSSSYNWVGTLTLSNNRLTVDDLERNGWSVVSCVVYGR